MDTGRFGSVYLTGNNSVCYRISLTYPSILNGNMHPNGMKNNFQFITVNARPPIMKKFKWKNIPDI